jgi:nickel-dependent lactate racemase
MPTTSEMISIELPYGRTPLSVSVPRSAEVLGRPRGAASRPVAEVLEEALDAPIGAAPLETRVAASARVTIVISDPTRAEPRDALLRAILRRLPDDIALTIAVATGTHGPCDLDALGVDPALLARARVVNHDGHRDDDLVPLGETRRGTPVRVHRCLLEADLVVATGVIRPHYFAGFGAGVKALFPGLGGNREIRINHAWKTDHGARAGVVDGNPCREDLDEVVDMLATPTFLLDLVAAPGGDFPSAVAGDLRAAFRIGAQRCTALSCARARRARTIVVSDAPPVTGSLYQASKLVAAVAPLLEDGGTIIVAAECWNGVGPVDVVNEAIYAIGLRPRLPPRHSIVLISSLTADQVASTYCRWAPDVATALAGAHADSLLVVVCATELIIEARA